jgi:cytochrome c553
MSVPLLPLERVLWSARPRRALARGDPAFAEARRTGALRPLGRPSGGRESRFASRESRQSRRDDRPIEYLLTDLRLVIRFADGADEAAAHDIVAVARRSGLPWRYGLRLALRASARSGDAPVWITLGGLSRRAALALVLQLSSLEGVEVDIDPALARDAMAEPLGWRRLATVGAAVVMVLSLAIGLRGDETAIVYPPDDAIVPGGVRRSDEEIERFMRDEVMPWARRVLGPVVGGADRVTCETCHGRDAEKRRWRMPGVAALPYPRVRGNRLEHAVGDSVDPQLRNAIYADLAQDEALQETAAYMRQVVMPGMAALLHRPPYDFTRPYRENRGRFAFGCYHCHRVK